MSILNEQLNSGPKPIERLRPLLRDPAFWQDLERLTTSGISKKGG